ncbi:UDP-N-acetylglucosamine--LPS N-acetylglucosamine transferase [Nocardioides panacis]|uniref:UDP-N-acetylglucosamine--LPS N-acetylglucosamine transferase n=1 Tax=Nocardioides panacis TaxID=2849501 RepID=A0A975SYT2_9ACTN|nr:UDP-N-acetylglucosamine--LPS N-acetylglucosamine transferase [Nocardioides panacis]QWZ08381.1 UDP-N-acetylglucosamine--LPS N-acetylglucosamine transferase [Nocardioides panacis]
MRVLLTCSTGGHLSQLYALKPWWSQHQRRWLTFDKPDARSLLKGESIGWAFHPTTRNIPNLIRNSGVAMRELRDFRPDVVVSTGAAVAVPVFYLARLMGIRTVYVEVYDRIDSATLTGSMCRPVADLFAVQWDEQLKMYPTATVIGPLM